MHGFGVHEHHAYTDTPGHSEFFVVDAATATARYTAAAGTAQTRYGEGVQAATKDPGQAAAAQQQKMLTNVTSAITSGYWARRVQEGGNLAAWKAAVQAKLSNYSTGIQAAGPAYQSGYTAFWNYMQAYYPTIISNPDPQARMNAWFTAASAYQKP